MRSRLTILLILIYILPSIGMNVSVHQCGGKITKVSLFNDEKSKKCKCSIRKMKADCCKDKTQLLKLELHQQKTDNFFSLDNFFKSIVKVIFNQTDNNFKYQYFSENKNYNSKPPDDISLPVYIKNRVLII